MRKVASPHTRQSIFGLNFIISSIYIPPAVWDWVYTNGFITSAPRPSAPSAPPTPTAANFI